MRSLGVLVLCALLFSGCNPHPGPPPAVDVGPRPDAFRDDAGRDAASVDAFSPTDSGFSPGSCHFDATTDLIDVDTDPRSLVRRIALAAGPTGFGVAYTKIGTDTFENLWLSEIPSDPAAPRARTQLTHDFFTTTTPALTHTAAGWLLAWLSNRDGNTEVYALGSGADGRLLTTPTRVTSTTLTEEEQPALASNGTDSLIAWADVAASTTVAQAINADGSVSGSPARNAPTGLDMRPQALTSAEFGFVVAWTSPTSDAMTQALLASGASSGSPVSLTPASHDAGSGIDVTISNGGGTVVYDSDNGGRPEVHAHLVDGVGGLLLDERVLTVGADSGGGAGVAELGGGYVVAYRQVGTPPMLRVLFLSSILDEVARLDITSVAAAGGGMSVRVAADNTVLIAWADIVGSATQIRAARIRCN